MMYVSGETGEPSVETTGMIEEIVRQQVIEILRNCTELAARRGSRTITINDLIFQIREDAAKVSRLRTFLSWKDVRKNVKDSDDKGADADIGAGEDPVGGVVAGPVDDAAKKNKKSKVGLPWEPSSFYSQEVPERDDEEDEEEEEMNHITLQRLRKADERTKVMTREEYVTWSEYRQASFTYRKGKRFREWAGFGIVTDGRPSDDIVDILGFLTFEMVQMLTEEALKLKEQEDLWKERTGGGEKTSKQPKIAAHGLFLPPSEGRTPVEARHVQEAFRRMQGRPKKSRAMLNGTRLAQHTALKLVSRKQSQSLSVHGNFLTLCICVYPVLNYVCNFCCCKADLLSSGVPLQSVSWISVLLGIYMCAMWHFCSRNSSLPLLTKLSASVSTAVGKKSCYPGIEDARQVTISLDKFLERNPILLYGYSHHPILMHPFYIRHDPWSSLALDSPVQLLQCNQHVITHNLWDLGPVSWSTHQALSARAHHSTFRIPGCRCPRRACQSAQ